MGVVNPKIHGLLPRPSRYEIWQWLGSLAGRLPSQLKIEEVKFWPMCRGDSCKELKTKIVVPVLNI